MATENVYNSLSTYSIASILFRYLFDASPTRVWIADKSFQLYPLGIPSGIVFYHKICDSIFQEIQVKYFQNPKSFSTLNDSMFDRDLIDDLFHTISDVYNIDIDDDLYDLLQKSNLKQIKYLLYTIKQQNFVYYESNQYNINSYSTVLSTINSLDKILSEYKNNKAANSGKNKLIDIDAIEYAAINTDIIKLDYTTQFYKDYIIGNEGFYSLLVNGYMYKFISISDQIPYFLRNDDPQYWCKLNNDRCIQSCRMFDSQCKKRYIKKFSYVPFRSIYILPQMISLMRSYNRELEIDVLIRAFMYSISASFGDKGNLKSYYTLDHNNSILAIIDKNKSNMIKNFFSDLNFDDVANEVRTSLGLSESMDDTFDRVYSTLIKMYKFIDGNKSSFIPDATRMEIFSEFVDIDLKVFLYEKRYDSSSLIIASDEDFTSYIESIAKEVINLDNMLMKFPNDMNNLDSLVNEFLKMLKSTKQNLAKMAGGKMPIDPREALLTSESILFRRIAIDTNLWEFYRQNNKTKMVNNINFWKWVLAWSFFSGIVLRFDDDHAIQTMNFNEI